MILAGARGEKVHFGQSTASLIDVVFLLLIYFMVTASLIRREGDIGFLIPTPSPGTLKEIPVEALICIRADGSVELEGMQFPRSDSSLDDLVMQLLGLRGIARTQQSEFYVNIEPHPDTLHYRIVDVMDACASAGVEHLGFSKSVD
ncbi:biopolymer transporter ExbD [Pontiellaceae bacterium B12227]|nr:biopolymer transporter ExbD [Pontiellaceae bacterium B12227]